LNNKYPDTYILKDTIFLLYLLHLQILRTLEYYFSDTAVIVGVTELNHNIQIVLRPGCEGVVRQYLRNVISILGRLLRFKQFQKPERNV